MYAGKIEKEFKDRFMILITGWITLSLTPMIRRHKTE